MLIFGGNFVLVIRGFYIRRAFKYGEKFVLVIRGLIFGRGLYSGEAYIRDFTAKRKE